MVRAVGDRVLRVLERIRIGPFRDGAFSSKLHSERAAAYLGLSLGVTFSVCFVTGLLSHLIQQPPDWLEWPPRPAGLYRITQGTHVITGIASIPLLFAKLWSVYPRLWAWPPVESILHGVERVSLVPLVGGSIFMVFTGLADTALWYPWTFFFPAGHYWGAWITVGALVVHIGAKAGIVKGALSHSRIDRAEPKEGGLGRRGFLGIVGASSALLIATTIGQTFGPLRRLALLAPRSPDVGPQGFPVNKTAAGAGVSRTAMDPDYRLSVEGAVRAPLTFAYAELQRLPQHEATLPISCVEGWSASARWTGIRVTDLLELAGAPLDATVTVHSLQRDGLYTSSEVNPSHARDEDTLLALQVNGERLHIDHGFPVRLIGPNRPGVMQTKWVSRLVVL